jgi:hypothetical protein
MAGSVQAFDGRVNDAALSAVAGHGASVIEVSVICGAELDSTVVIQPGGDPGLWSYRFDDHKITVGNAQLLVRSGELNPVADGEAAHRSTEYTDARESERIISGGGRTRILDP